MKRYVFATFFFIFLALFTKSFFYSDDQDIEKTFTYKKNDTITVHYHERTPYYVTTPYGVAGLCADPVAAAFKITGIPMKWEKTPPKRQLVLIEKNQSKDCIIGWFKTDEREAVGRFSVPLYQDKPMIAVTRAGVADIKSEILIERFLCDSKFTLLVKDGYSYGAYIDEKIEKWKPKLETTTGDNMDMLHMIEAGRADYFFITQEEADDLIRASGYPVDAFRYIRFSDMPPGNERYLICSKQVPEEVMQVINDALIKVRGAF